MLDSAAIVNYIFRLFWNIISKTFPRPAYAGFGMHKGIITFSINDFSKGMQALTDIGAMS